MTNADDRDKPARMLLLVQDRIGYLNLCSCCRAWLATSRGRAELEPGWLEEPGEEGLPLATGLIALSGAMGGDVGQALANGTPRRRAVRRALGRVFPQRFYIELQRAGQPGTEAYVRRQLAASLQLPVVATHPVQFMTPDDFTRTRRASVSPRANCWPIRAARASSRPTSTSRRRTRWRAVRRYPVGAAELGRDRQALQPDAGAGQATPAAVPDARRHVARRLPVFMAKEGLEKRLLVLFPDEAERESKRAEYYARLEFETGTIIKMGFPGYFLIVADFINWAKNNGVPVGPGRGSGAGSLVAYALGITDLDPLKYALLFERFLNPERVSMPDFDIDFCQHGRDRVITYVKEKYGKDAVSQIATFGTMAAKAAVRDVGRVLDLGYGFVDGVAKLIPFKPGKLVTLEEAKKEEPALAERERTEEEVRQLLELAQRVEGMTRNVGMHAGGVLIAPGKPDRFLPALHAGHGRHERRGQPVRQGRRGSGRPGQVRLLGLTTLTILDWAERYIRRLDPSKADWNCSQIPLDDSPAFDILKSANTVAVFQLESRGMQGMLKDAKPDRFEDIIALVALYRPGPMDLIPSFCARKHGREKVEYPDPRVEPVLKETYGIMVYQEQVMQMAQIIGGYSLGGADLLRRAMGKKKPEEMAKHRDMFREGADKNGLTAQQADDIFDLMEKFAGYGFNKSHAAAYALLAYYTAWLKAHHPAEFMAANMSLAMDDTDKVKILYEDCRLNKIEVLPPDVNASEYRFAPTDAKTIRYGLGGIKGSGQGAIEDILRAREERPFDDLFDFCERVDRRQVNRRTIEALIRAGAFDSLNDNRAQLLASVSIAMEAADQKAESANQVSLFDLMDDAGASHRPELVDEPRWTPKRTLQEEKQALGYYFSGHLFDASRDEVRRFVKGTLAALEKEVQGNGGGYGRDVRGKVIAGVITGIRTQMTQRGKLIIVLLDDGTAQIEMTVFNELYDANRHMFREDELLIAQGNARHDTFTGGVRFTADSVQDLVAARARYADAVCLGFNGNASTERLRELLTPYLAHVSQTPACRFASAMSTRPRSARRCWATNGRSRLRRKR
jgi:DNA polymerase-3 subunit alpha